MAGFIVCIGLLVFENVFLHGVHSQPMDVWLTTGDETRKLEPGTSIPPNSGEDPTISTVTIWMNSGDQYVKGFGAALSNSAAYLIYNSPERDVIIQDLFSPADGIGIEYIRLVMGGSDFNAVEPYTYDDVESGEDFEMAQFTIEKDQEFMIPLIKLINETNPNVKILASPWSAPAWMKTSESLNGGELKAGDEYLAALADYFVRFIQAYDDEGISIDAITLQNEPQYAEDGYPTMIMSSDVQALLIKNHVGPKFLENGITAEVIIWDHNWDQPDYPMAVLDDPVAKQYVRGTAWHCYAGDLNAPGGIRNQHPDIDVYFTECSGGEWDTDFASALRWNYENLFIGQVHQGARSVLLWNMALDENFGPRVGVTGGCSDCRGVVTIPSEGTYERNVEYYSIGHMSKFIRQDAIRKDTEQSNFSLKSTSFQNPDGSVVVVVVNLHEELALDFQISLDYQYYPYQLPPSSVVTFVRQLITKD